MTTFYVVTVIWFIVFGGFGCFGGKNGLKINKRREPWYIGVWAVPLIVFCAGLACFVTAAIFAAPLVAYLVIR